MRSAHKIDGIITLTNPILLTNKTTVINIHSEEVDFYIYS